MNGGPEQSARIVNPVYSNPAYISRSFTESGGADDAFAGARVSPSGVDESKFLLSRVYSSSIDVLRRNCRQAQAWH
jgi:hypothetical protein